jgi:hypothetical protein
MLRPQNYFKPPRRRNFWNSSAIVLAANCAISLILIGLAMSCPPASRWISEAVQAEFTGIAMPDTAPAQPAQQTRIVRSD